MASAKTSAIASLPSADFPAEDSRDLPPPSTRSMDSVRSLGSDQSSGNMLALCGFSDCSDTASRGSLDLEGRTREVEGEISSVLSEIQAKLSWLTETRQHLLAVAKASSQSSCQRERLLEEEKEMLILGKRKIVLDWEKKHQQMIDTYEKKLQEERDRYMGLEVQVGQTRQTDLDSRQDSGGTSTREQVRPLPESSRARDVEWQLLEQQRRHDAVVGALKAKLAEVESDVVGSLKVSKGRIQTLEAEVRKYRKQVALLVAENGRDEKLLQYTGPYRGSPPFDMDHLADSLSHLEESIRNLTKVLLKSTPQQVQDTYLAKTLGSEVLQFRSISNPGDLARLVRSMIHHHVLLLIHQGVFLSLDELSASAHTVSLYQELAVIVDTALLPSSLASCLMLELKHNTDPDIYNKALQILRARHRHYYTVLTNGKGLWAVQGVLDEVSRKLVRVMADFNIPWTDNKETAAALDLVVKAAYTVKNLASSLHPWYSFVVDGLPNMTTMYSSDLHEEVSQVKVGVGRKGVHVLFCHRPGVVFRQLGGGGALDGQVKGVGSKLTVRRVELKQKVATLVY